MITLSHRGPFTFDVEAPVPALDVALDQDDLGVRVRPDEVLGESHGGRVRAHGAAVAEQLIPVRPSEGLAVAAEFGVHGFVPHRAVPDVGEKLHGGLAGVAEDGKCGLHRDGAVASPAIDVGDGEKELGGGFVNGQATRRHGSGRVRMK